jgi:hypothetical protein
MNVRKTFFTGLLALTVAAVPLEMALAGTTSQARSQRPGAADINITDAAGRVHRVMPMRSLTAEQRKAAAKRAQATRDAKFGKGSGTVEGGVK